MNRKGWSVLCLLPCACWLLTPVYSADKKLTEDDRIEILRGLMSEYATVKTILPRSKKPLPFEANGTWDKQTWAEAAKEFGPAARVGDQVQITTSDHRRRQDPAGDQPRHERQQRRLARSRASRHGGGGGMSPVSTQQNTNAPSGTNIAVLFNKPIPPIKAADIKKMLTPVLDFEKQTATENYVEKLPEPVQKAIKANKAIEGMDRDQVLLALGKPRHKERNVTADGAETEDWIYGDPPGKITFVIFTGSKVTQIKEAYADVGGSTAAPLPVR